MSELRILFGFHAVDQRLRRRPQSVVEILLDSGRRDARALDVAARARAHGVRVMEAETARLDALSENGRHQGVIARVRATEPAASLESLLDTLASPALLLVLDGVQDPHNLGACLRVADAFGAQGVIAPKDNAASMTPAVAKAASGAAESVPYVQVTNLARALNLIKRAGVWVMGADQNAQRCIDAAALDGPVAWVLGAESSGLRRLTRERCDELLRVPIGGIVGSLNVSVAAGICLYETSRQRAAKASGGSQGG